MNRWEEMGLRTEAKWGAPMTIRDIQRYREHPDLTLADRAVLDLACNVLRKVAITDEEARALEEKSRRRRR